MICGVQRDRMGATRGVHGQYRCAKMPREKIHVKNIGPGFKQSSVTCYDLRVQMRKRVQPGRFRLMQNAFEIGDG